MCYYGSYDTDVVMACASGYKRLKLRKVERSLATALRDNVERG